MHFRTIMTNSLVILTVIELSLSEKDFFKINKLNLIWHKAQHSLGSTKLKDLKNDLLKHEADELSLKTLKAHNQDKDGLFEASVRKKLLSITSKYSLDSYLNDITATLTPGSGTSGKKLNDITTFRDSKLDKLWKKAEKAGFDQDQLMILHEEFQHQQDKLDDHYETMNMIEQEINQSAMRADRKENSIEVNPSDGVKKKYDVISKSRKETESEKKARFEENIHQSLRDKHSEIKKGIDKLSKKIASGVVDDGAPFREKRVNDLWTTASQSNFTEAELQSLKEELSHYEGRIEKLKHFQNELERHKLGAKDSKSYVEDDKEMKHVKKKVKELVQKVEKSDRTIEKKILREEL